MGDASSGDAIARTVGTISAQFTEDQIFDQVRLSTFTYEWMVPKDRTDLFDLPSPLIQTSNNEYNFEWRMHYLCFNETTDILSLSLVRAVRASGQSNKIEVRTQCTLLYAVDADNKTSPFGAVQLRTVLRRKKF